MRETSNGIDMDRRQAQREQGVTTALNRSTQEESAVSVGWVEPQRGEAHQETPRPALGGPRDLRSFDPPYFPYGWDLFRS